METAWSIKIICGGCGRNSALPSTNQKPKETIFLFRQVFFRHFFFFGEEKVDMREEFVLNNSNSFLVRNCVLTFCKKMFPKSNWAVGSADMWPWTCKYKLGEWRNILLGHFIESDRAAHCSQRDRQLPVVWKRFCTMCNTVFFLSAGQTLVAEFASLFSEMDSFFFSFFLLWLLEFLKYALKASTDGFPQRVIFPQRPCWLRSASSEQH